MVIFNPNFSLTLKELLALEGWDQSCQVYVTLTFTKKSIYTYYQHTKATLRLLVTFETVLCGHQKISHSSYQGQQTREVREKPLINYRFLRAAASVVLRDLVAAELPCPAANAAIAASPASLASPGPSAVGLATQVQNQCHSLFRGASQAKRRDGHEGEAAMSERLPQRHPEAFSREEPRHTA